jgi:hypothetical protein
MVGTCQSGSSELVREPHRQDEPYRPSLAAYRLPSQFLRAYLAGVFSSGLKR